MGATFNCGHPRTGKNVQSFKNGKRRSDRCRQCNVDEAIKRGRRLREIATNAAALLAKLDECEPFIADAFLHRFLRFGEYTGPNYAAELAALRTSLAPAAQHDGPGERG